MTTPNEPGWYDDPNDPDAERYWDGQDWTPHRQRKSASPAAGVAAPPNQPPPIAVTPTSSAHVAPTSFVVDTRGNAQPADASSQLAAPASPIRPPVQGSDMGDGAAEAWTSFSKYSVAAWLLIGGLVATVIASFFPYATVSANILGSAVFALEVSLDGTSRAVVVGLVAASTVLALPAFTGSVTPVWRLITLGALVGILAVLMVIWFGDVSSQDRDLQRAVEISPGFGLLLYGAGVCATAAGVIRLCILRARMPNST